MSNDIQKYRYLIETIILDESFKDAERIFTDVNGNQKEVSSYIALFKELAKRNKIQGIEKDISRWIKSGWEEFKEFVDSKKDIQSKREVKSIQKKDSIQVYKDEEKQVVIPLTKEASIQYGKNTRWCTSATESTNYFTKYFYINKITLFYVLFKNGDKYACAFQPDQPNEIEYFDQEDYDMTYNEFSKVTGISKNDIHEWYSSNNAVIMKSQDINKIDEATQIVLVKENGELIKHLKKPSEEVQLAAVKLYAYALKYIIKLGITPSEEVQFAAVQNNGFAIQDIIDKGITPSGAVQLAAVQKDGFAIELIDNPTEEVQFAAVKQNGYAIEHIDNPSEEVQLAAVKQNGFAIRYIDNPSEEVQLAAVKRNPSAITYIIDKGITPGEEVQLAAVKQNPSAITYIIDKGITPSEKVKELHNKLYN